MLQNDHPPVKRDPNNVIIPAKREPRKSTWQRERNSKHELLERIHSLQNDMNQYKRDLYPLGEFATVKVNEVSSMKTFKYFCIVNRKSSEVLAYF